MAKRLVVPAQSLSEGPVTLPDDLARYVRQVLRCPAGTEIELCDGEGTLAMAELVTVDKKRVQLVVQRLERHPRAGPEITLLQGVGKGDKVDQVIRQAAELGVRRIVPVHTERTVAGRQQRHERWLGIAEDAVRVAGHLYRPEITPVRPLSEALGAPTGLALVMALDGAEPLGRRLAAAESLDAITVLVGPEGGLSPGEVQAAAAAGYLPTHLGPRTLRTETAGPAVVAIVAFAAGRLGGPIDPPAA